MAALSRLDITPGEAEIFRAQLGDILGHMAVLNNVDTADVEPLYNIELADDTMRQDICANLRTRQEILQNAPETDGQYFIVPQII